MNLIRVDNSCNATDTLGNFFLYSLTIDGKISYIAAPTKPIESDPTSPLCALCATSTVFQFVQTLFTSFKNISPASVSSTFLFVLENNVTPISFLIAVFVD